jgi:hypothetical protein
MRGGACGLMSLKILAHDLCVVIKLKGLSRSSSEYDWFEFAAGKDIICYIAKYVRWCSRIDSEFAMGESRLFDGEPVSDHFSMGQSSRNNFENFIQVFTTFSRGQTRVYWVY